MLCIFAFKRVLYCIILTFVLLKFSHHQSSEPTFCIILNNLFHSKGGGPSLPDHLLPRLLGLWTCPLLLINVQPTKWAFNVKTCQFYWGKGLAHYSYPLASKLDLCYNMLCKMKNIELCLFHL